MSVRETTVDALAVADPIEVARRQFDWASVDPTAGIAEVLAEVKECEPAEVGPLYDLVDSDALDALVRSPRSASDCAVVFPYEDLSVTVTGTGDVAVYSAGTDEQ